MASFLQFLSGFEGAGVGFIAGCLVWNYLGDKIKVWLHLKEAQVGAEIKDKINQAKTKL